MRQSDKHKKIEQIEALRSGLSGLSLKDYLRDLSTNNENKFIFYYICLFNRRLDVEKDERIQAFEKIYRKEFDKNIEYVMPEPPAWFLDEAAKMKRI